MSSTSDLDEVSRQFEKEFVWELNNTRLYVARDAARLERQAQLATPSSPSSASVPRSDVSKGENEVSRDDDVAVDDDDVSKCGAPPGSLLSILSSRLVPELGSMDEVSLLWREVVKELRWHWDHLVPIPLDIAALPALLHRDYLEAERPERTEGVR
jgi:hypothetical protein